MKKLCSIYKSDMFRALLYKTVRRLAVAACLCLLWERFVSDGRFTIWEAPCFAVGAALLGWAWVAYLRLDGIRIPFVDRQKGLSDRERRRLERLANDKHAIEGLGLVAMAKRAKDLTEFMTSATASISGSDGEYSWTKGDVERRLKLAWDWSRRPTPEELRSQFLSEFSSRDGILRLKKLLLHYYETYADKDGNVVTRRTKIKDPSLNRLLSKVSEDASDDAFNDVRRDMAINTRKWQKWFNTAIAGSIRAKTGTIYDTTDVLSMQYLTSFNTDYWFGRQEVRTTLSEATDNALSDSDLVFDDEDLPRALFKLKKTAPERYRDFLYATYSLFPTFEDVSVDSYELQQDMRDELSSVIPQEEDENESVPLHLRDELYRITIRDSNLNQPVDISRMSEGTKRLIWLLTNVIVAGEINAGCIGIEEVETSIHPRMLKELLELLHDNLRGTPLLLTSHSPNLIQYLDPTCVYVGVPSSNGVATFKRISRSSLRTVLENARARGIGYGDYLFELMSSDEDGLTTLSEYLEG